MKFEVITSFNQEYYDKIGQDAVSSYLAHWSTPLTVYAEDCKVPHNHRIRTIDFDQLGPDYEQYQQDDAVTRRSKVFAKKAFSVIHALYHSDADWLVWLDADTLTTSSDPAQLLDQILQPRFLAMFMGVRYTDHRNNKFGDWLVPETGLFAVNLKHPETSQFRDEYRRRYVERDFADLRRSYDNDVLGAVITKIDAEYLDLCAKFSKPYKTPLKHTVFGEYLHHYKAKHSKLNYAAVQ